MCPSAASHEGHTPAPHGHSPGSDSAAHPTAGCHPSDDGHRSQQPTNHTNRTTRRQAVFFATVCPRFTTNLPTADNTSGVRRLTWSTTDGCEYCFLSQMSAWPRNFRRVLCSLTRSCRRSKSPFNPCITTPMTRIGHNAIPRRPRSWRTWGARCSSRRANSRDLSSLSSQRSDWAHFRANRRDLSSLSQSMC